MIQVEIRPPELGGGTEEEQLRRIQNYLYTLAEQLQYAFDGVAREQDAVQASVQRAQKPGESASLPAVKSLILRSAEVTQKLSEQVQKRLTGLYVAQSQFGTFRQQTEQLITASADQLRQEFSNLQQIESELAGVQSTLQEVSASIRTGALYESADGVPVYGLEIGQQTVQDGVTRFRRFARLTAEKLSFYDSNDVEVAYISDRRLHVTGADFAAISADSAVLGGLQMGEYTWQLGPDGHLSLR